MLDVILVYPPSIFNKNLEGMKDYKVANKKIGVWPPLGLHSLATCLHQEGISARVLDAFTHGYSIQQLIECFREYQPKIIGISLTTLQTRATVQLAEAIKKEFNSSIKVIAGGPHISVDPGFVEEFQCFDTGIIGEAEITFPKVVKNILAGERIKGIYHAEIPKNLDELPEIDRSDVKLKDYFDFEKPVASMFTSRGCPFQCIFCSRVAVSDRVRLRNPLKVVDEIESLKDEYKNNFIFTDDTFTISKTNTLQICEEIIKRGLKIKWLCNTRANLLDEELLSAMKRSGCHSILIGVESGNEEFRNKVVKKNISDQSIRDVVSWCKKLKMTIGGYFMLGFPGENKKLIQETVNFPKKFKLDIMSIHLITVYPGSGLAKIMEKEKKINVIQEWRRYARGEVSFDELPVLYIPKDLTLLDLQKARREAYMKFYFRPEFIFKKLWSDLTSWNNLKIDILTAYMLLRYGHTSKDLK